MPLKLEYDQAWLPHVADSFGNDFWQFGPVTKSLVSMVQGPVKFTESVSIYVPKGNAKFTLSLRQYEVSAPFTIFIREGEILQVDDVSDDLEAHCMLFSKGVIESLFALVTNVNQLNEIRRNTIHLIPESVLTEFDDFYNRMSRIWNDKENPSRIEAVLFQTASFFYQISHLLIPLTEDENMSVPSRTVEVFLRLVRRNFRQERFLEFYADKMKITPKHLSRTIKQQTGLTAAEWIERHIILESKVLLRSSTMSIQQIANYLNFPTQSFFSKYFRKAVGQSPSEFRAK